MWIYAITRAVAEHKGYKWGFNPVPEYDYFNGAPQMDFMDIDYGIKHNFKYEETPDWIEHTWYELYYHMDFPSGDSMDYHRYQPGVFNIEDNTKLFIRCCQDARYLFRIKESVKSWFKIRDEKTEEYESLLKHYDIILDKNLAVINIRGGEYKGVLSLILTEKYWEDAIRIMEMLSPNIRFLCISDDIEYANRILNNKIPVIHLSIGGDYYIINNAKNLILSNSSFAIFPAWLNNNNPYVIAPRYWARHNVSTGYWANSDIFTFGWNFLDKDGHLYNENI